MENKAVEKKKYKTETTKSKIVESAIYVIYKKDYSRTTLEDIVKNIGLTRVAFYWSFKSKKEASDIIVQMYEENYLSVVIHVYMATLML